MIEIKDLTKTYDTSSGPVVGLDHIDLSVKKGEIFGVIGKSGAGKSTLIRCINLLEKPTKGSIHIAGVDVTQLSGKALREERRKIGMIFQHFNLLSSKTVYQNIALPLKLVGKETTSIKQRVDALLELTGLSDKREVYPAQLSGGQKQRVAIARALASEPDLLLCDEATSALDPHTTASILHLLRDINHKLKLTIVLITHEMSVIKDICDRVAILEKGKLVEKGDVLQIFTQPAQKVTRDLIRTALRIDLPPAIKNRLRATRVQPNDQPLIRLTFIGSTTSKPFLSKLTERFALEFNILQANIELIHDNPVGIMLVQALASESQTAEFLQYAQEKGLNAEVLGYVN